MRLCRKTAAAYLPSLASFDVSPPFSDLPGRVVNAGVSPEHPRAPFPQLPGVEERRALLVSKPARRLPERNLVMNHCFICHVKLQQDGLKCF